MWGDVAGSKLQCWTTGRGAPILVLTLLLVAGCGGGTSQVSGSDTTAASGSSEGVWVRVASPAPGVWQASLTGKPIANQPVRWGLLTGEGAAVETGAATTDGTGTFQFKAKRDLAVVLVVEHERWSAWVELPK